MVVYLGRWDKLGRPGSLGGVPDLRSVIVRHIIRWLMYIEELQFIVLATYAVGE